MSNNLQPLTRRRVLAGTGTALALATAGCTGGGSTGNPEDNSDNPDPTTEETTEEEDTTEETTDEGEPSFEIVEINHPEEVEIGERYDYSIEVKNTGDATGTWTETVSGKFGYEEDWVEIDTPSETLAPGETTTITYEDAWSSALTTFTVRLEEAQQEFTVQFVAANLNFGETYSSPYTMELTVTDVELKPYYEYEGYSGTTKERAGDGQQWAFVYVRAENKGDEANYAPSTSDISIMAGNRQYDQEYISKEEGVYEDGEISPGIVREGWIAYKVPSDLSKSDLRVAWVASTYEADWTVRWSV